MVLYSNCLCSNRNLSHLVAADDDNHHSLNFSGCSFLAYRLFLLHFYCLNYYYYYVYYYNLCHYLSLNCLSAGVSVDLMNFWELMTRVVDDHRKVEMLVSWCCCDYW